MFAAITSGLISASLSIMGRLASKVFFESVLEKVIIYGLDKIASSTENTLDDDIVKDIKGRLKSG